MVGAGWYSRRPPTTPTRIKPAVLSDEDLQHRSVQLYEYYVLFLPPVCRWMEARVLYLSHGYVRCVFCLKCWVCMARFCCLLGFITLYAGK